MEIAWKKLKKKYWYIIDQGSIKRNIAIKSFDQLTGIIIKNYQVVKRE